MDKNLKDQAINGAKWAAIEKFSLQIIQFGLGIILARLLSPSDYGTVGMLGIFIAISNTFIDSGFSSALIRKLERTEDDYSTVFFTNFAISIAFALVLVGIAPWVAKFYNMPILCPILRVQSLSLILYALAAVQTAKLAAEVNFKTLAKANLIAAPLSGVIGIGLAYIGWGVWALVCQNLLSAALRLIFIILQCRWFPKWRFSKQSFDELWGFGKNMLGASLLSAIYFNLDSIIIGKFFTPASLGNYTRGTQIARLPVDNINGVLNNVTYPVLAKLQNDTERLIAAYRKYIKLTSMCIFFCCTLLAALAKPLILFLLTDKWINAIIYLQVFSFAIMFDHLCVINLNLIKIKGRSDLILKLEVIKRIISFAILFAAIPFGVLGICVSKVIYTFIAVYINTYYNGKLFGMGFISQFNDYSKYLLLSLITCAPALLIATLGLPNIVSLALGATISAALYWLLLRNDDTMKEAIGLVSSRVFKKAI